MQIPNEVQDIFQKIADSELRWKALYAAAWGYAGSLERQFKDTPRWTQPASFALPASRKKQQSCTMEKMHKILTSKDNEFTLGHLQTLFSLLEELVNTVCPIVNNGKTIRADKWANLEKFLTGVSPYDNFNLKIGKTDLGELHIAKETRNCFIHKGSKVDAQWIGVYEGVKKRKPRVKPGDPLPVTKNLHKVEAWHELILKIVGKIEATVKKMPSNP